MNQFKTLATALAFTTALTTSAYAATKVGVVGAANPDVIAKSEDGTTRTLKAGDEVFLNDELITNAKGSAQLMFLDKSALTISPNSTIIVDTFVYDPATKDGAMNINSAKGAFRFIGGALTKKKAVTIKTPVSTIGIRGGIVDAHVSPSGETQAVFLFGKEMSMTGQNGQTITTSQFGTGQGVLPGGAPTVLPGNVVSGLISNSPTASAVSVAPPSANGAGIDTKIQLNSGAPAGGSDSGTGGGASDTGASGGAAGSSGSGDGSNGGGEGGGNTPAGGEPTGAAPEGNSGSAMPPANGDGAGAGPVNNNGALAGPANGPAAGGNTPGALAGLGNNPATGGAANGPAALPWLNNPAVAAGPVGGVPLGGNTSQENLRNTTNQFVNTGGQGAGPNGTVPFNLTNLNPQFINTIQTGTGPVGPNGPNGPNGPRPGFVPPVNPNGPIPPAGTLPPTGTLPPITALPVPTLGGGNVTPPPPPPNNTAPVALPSTLAGGMEYTVMPNAHGVKHFTLAELLAGATDAEGHPLSILPGSLQVVSGDAEFNYNHSIGGANFRIEDVKPGESETFQVSYVVSDGNGGYVTRTMNITINGQDYFGGANLWTVTLPNLPTTQPTATRYGGGLGYRDKPLDTMASGETGRGSIDAFKGEADSLAGGYEHRYADKLVYNGVINQIDNAIVSGNDPDNRVIGYLQPIMTPGVTGFGPNMLRIEDIDGRMDVSDGFSGYHYGTNDLSFHFYKTMWNDNNGTATVSDDALQYYRAYLLTSPLYDTSLASAGNANTAYDNMLDGAANSIAANNGIIEYDFLPDLVANLTGDQFGLLNYNKHGSFGGSPNQNGLFVDWANKRFIGGHVNFLGATPSMVTVFGKVNDSSSATIGGTNGNFWGNALDGNVASLKLDSTFANIASNKATVRTDVSDIAVATGANKPIEALVLDIRNAGSTTISQQPVVIGSGQAGLDAFNPGGDILYKSYTAGLAMDDTEVTRISGQNDIIIESTDHSVTTGSNKWKFSNHDSVAGPALDFSVAGSVGFDLPNPTNSAALQNDTYAAQIQSTVGVNPVSGAIVAMGNELGGTDGGGNKLVCNTCQFAHWGVWSATMVDNVNPNVTLATTALVPYVAGEAYDVPAAGALGGQTGTVNYNGDIAANVKNGGTFQNVTGNFNAAIDMDNRKITSFSGNMSGMPQFGFNGTYNEGTNYTTNSGYVFSDATNSFNGVVGRTDGGGAFTELNGTINGALFGPTAEELGGSFNVKNNVTNDLAGGIYLGKR